MIRDIYQERAKAYTSQLPVDRRIANKVYIAVKCDLGMCSSLDIFPNFVGLYDRSLIFVGIAPMYSVYKILYDTFEVILNNLQII